MENLIKHLAMEKLEYYIEEGTANRGWYTCLKTGKKFRGEEARKQFEKQKQTEQRIRESLEQEMASNDSEEVIVSGKVDPEFRSEERRVGKECKSRGTPA